MVEIAAASGPPPPPAAPPAAGDGQRPALDAGAVKELSPVTGAVLQSSNAVNALIHLYRGELGRMTAYRSRLDTTTNWAITTSAAATTFTLSSDERTHVAFLFVMGLLYFFLSLEARRFSAYESSRRRTRLLERSFFPEVLGAVNAADARTARWLNALLVDLQAPVYPAVSTMAALSWRLRRIYLWLYAGILLAWLNKLQASPRLHLDFVSRASVGEIPGWLVCLAVAALHGWLVFVAFHGGARHPLDDPQTHDDLPRTPVEV